MRLKALAKLIFVYKQVLKIYNKMMCYMLNILKEVYYEIKRIFCFA